MATFKAAKTPKPIEMNTFLGLNESVGETEIKFGESVELRNFRITNNFKVQSRPGQLTLLDYENEKNINGLWYGWITPNEGTPKEILISINDGKVYEYNFSTEVNSLLGTITDSPCSIFWFQSKIYFLNGTDYKQYDGTTYADVVGYIPTVYINREPDGTGGTIFEPINLLTGVKKMTFIADGTSTTYVLPETDIGAALVELDDAGTPVVELVGFTVDRTADDGAEIDFSAGSSPYGAPADQNEVTVYWTKVVSGHSDLVKKNAFAIDFGPGNDTAVFIWGNPDAKNRRSWCGTLDASYWPVFNFTLIGTDQFAITDIAVQYSRQIILKEDRAFFSKPEYVLTTESYIYPVYDLNERVGNVAFGQSQVVENNPVTLSGKSMWRWSNTQVEDERNANIISERIRQSLEDLDLSTAVTLDYEKEKEYWLNIGSYVYIWNYGNDTFYVYDNISAERFVLGYDTIYFGGTGNGKIIEINSDYVNDDDVAIENEMELGFTDFGIGNYLKNSRKMWLTIEPASRTSVSTLWQTDRKSLTDDNALEYKFVLMDYGAIDYADWSYETNRNPQPTRFKIRAKKYSYIKFIFKNSEADETLTILSLNVQAETTSEVR